MIAVASLCVGGGEATASEAVPKKYVDQARELIDLLRDPIESEADGAEESKVRRKADAAKEKVETKNRLLYFCVYVFYRDLP